MVFAFAGMRNTGRSHLTRILTLHLLARYILAVFYVAWGFAEVGNKVQVLFWFALGVYGIAVGVLWTGRKLVALLREAGPQGLNGDSDARRNLEQSPEKSDLE
jgi:hypothetical protein